MFKHVFILLGLLLLWSTIVSASTVTELNSTGYGCSGGTTGGGCTSASGGNFTSPSFTPTTGDTVLVCMAVQNGPTYSITTSGYTWNHTTQFTGGGDGTGIQIWWATSVPSGAATFLTGGTTGINYGTATFAILDVSAPGAQDQIGSGTTGNSAGLVTTAGNLAASNEIGIAVLFSDPNGVAQGTVTALSGWTPFTQIVNGLYSTVDIDYNVSAGTSGSTLTGGYSAFVGGGTSQAGVIITFQNAGGGAVIGSELIGPSEIIGPNEIQ